MIVQPYYCYAPIYHFLEVFFKRRLAAAIASLPMRPNDKLLDIGIGTGFSLRHYPANLDVTGVDLCISMLRQARRRLPNLRPDSPPNRTWLLRADALNLPFHNRMFDLVFMSHTISTVDDPHRCLAEAMRVAKDHAHIMLVNHFRANTKWMRRWEKLSAPFCELLGWQTDVSLAELLEPWGITEVPASTEMFQTILLQKSPRGVRIVPVVNALEVTAPVTEAEFPVQAAA